MHQGDGSHGDNCDTAITTCAIDANFYMFSTTECKLHLALFLQYCNISTRDYTVEPLHVYIVDTIKLRPSCLSFMFRDLEVTIIQM